MLLLLLCCCLLLWFHCCLLLWFRCCVVVVVSLFYCCGFIGSCCVVLWFLCCGCLLVRRCCCRRLVVVVVLLLLYCCVGCCCCCVVSLLIVVVALFRLLLLLSSLSCHFVVDCCVVLFWVVVFVDLLLLSFLFVVVVTTPTATKFLHQIQLFLELRDSRFHRNIQIKLQIEDCLQGPRASQKEFQSFNRYKMVKVIADWERSAVGVGMINNVIEGDDEEKDDDATETQHDTICNDNIEHRMKHNNMNSLTEMIGSLTSEKGHLTYCICGIYLIRMVF